MATPTAPTRPEGGEQAPVGLDVDLDRLGRRVGYLVAVVVNLVMLWVVGQVTGWHLTRFLTDRFGEVRPYLVLSLLVSVAVNVVYLARDDGLVRSIGQLLTLGVGVVAMVVTVRVFPFDFADYAVDWAPLLRVILVIGLVGSAVALVVELVRAIRRTGRLA